MLKKSSIANVFFPYLIGAVYFLKLISFLSPIRTTYCAPACQDRFSFRFTGNQEVYEIFLTHRFCEIIPLYIIAADTFKNLKLRL